MYKQVLVRRFSFEELENGINHALKYLQDELYKVGEITVILHPNGLYSVVIEYWTNSLDDNKQESDSSEEDIALT